jgi:hypothetical protein
MENIHNKKEPIIENKNQVPFPTRTSDPPITIIDQAKEIENAETALKTVVNSKLELILKQIRNLQEEARNIIESAHEDVELHKVKCNFQKIPEQIIYLYEKDDDTKYFSLISPLEWNNNPPHKFSGAYKMKIDHSFEKIGL